jgi:toxin ParE1/3/4
LVRVVWTRPAVRKLDLIQAYIEQFDPDAARRMAADLVKAGESLRTFPNRGRLGQKGRRELPSVPPFVIEYEVRGDTVYILRVRHGAQRPD